MKDYLELTKPRITWLIVMSTAVGYYFGHTGSWSYWNIVHSLIGTALIASGTAALNQWYEREADRQMHRTQMRPLPSGRLSPSSSALVWYRLGCGWGAWNSAWESIGFPRLWGSSR